MTKLRTLSILTRLDSVMRGRPLADPAVPPPFFIVGSGRSGNTLLRAMLEAGDEVSIPPETYVLGDVIRKWKRWSRLPWDDVLHICLGTLEHYPEFDKFPNALRGAFSALNVLPEGQRSLARVLHEFYAEYARATKPTALRFGDKTPLNHLWLPELHEVFPDARFVHMVRDGRDVVRSYLEMGRCETLHEAAHRWLDATGAIESFERAHPGLVLRVRYEDLVSDPESALREVCAFLSLSFDQRMLAHDANLGDLGDVQRAAHHSSVMRSVNTDSVERWRTYFDEDEARELATLLGARLRSLGYESR